MKARSKWFDGLAILSLLALTIAFFWKIALTNRILAGLDLFTYFYPYREYAAQIVKAGHLPLWNPYLFLGVPFLANIQTAVLYPLNFLFLWLPAPKMVACSIVLHTFLAGLFTYLFTRRALGVGPWGSFVAGLVFSLGGVLGAQAEHVNQLSVLAWLPLLLLLFHLAHERGSTLYTLLTSLVVALQFLAGHAQASFINLVALAGYGVYLGSGERSWSRWRHLFCLLLVTTLLGVGLAAAQLVPTGELSRLSVRGGGLAYREAVSFSLKPTSLLLSLLPSFASSPFSEYIAYVGVSGLLLALLALFRSHRRREVTFFSALALLGLFLALGLYNPFYYLLYRLVPGFSFFRVPARWLLLYTWGMAILAGMGMESLREAGTIIKGVRRTRFLALALLLIAFILLPKPPLTIVLLWVGLSIVGLAIILKGGRWARPLFLILLVGELLGASRYLAYNRATAPEAYSSLRTAVGHLLADDGLYRILSLSHTSFDPGDLKEIEEIFQGQLSPEEIYDYIVATKWKEVLAPNLPLRYRIATVDGYDGGVLPLARYVEMETLFLEEPSIDGRLQQHLKEVPSGRLLSLLNVKYVIRDKAEDLWVDGVYYDLGMGAALGPGESLVLSEIPWFPATSLGVISWLEGSQGVVQGSPVAEVKMTDGQGHTESHYLRAGEDTAEEEYRESTHHREARVVRRRLEGGSEYHTLVELAEPVEPREIEVKSLLPQGKLHLQGMSLIDERTDTHRSLVVSSEGRYRLVHSGDVKIYENLDNLPRAFVVHQARALDDEAALEAMKDEGFEPAREVIVSQGPLPPLGEERQDRVSILNYQPERVVVEAQMGTPGYLVLSEAYYPGWRSVVDGQSVRIEQVDYYFRGVYLERGEHRVEFVYDPLSFKVGSVISLACFALVISGLGWERIRLRRARGI